MAWTCRVASKTIEYRLVRIAELEIDPAQLQAYTTALKEEISLERILTKRFRSGFITMLARGKRAQHARTPAEMASNAEPTSAVPAGD
jgi:hypothetical protein